MKRSLGSVCESIRSHGNPPSSRYAMKISGSKRRMLSDKKYITREDIRIEDTSLFIVI